MSGSDEPQASGAFGRRFEPGTHLRVRRPSGYTHHGVYISDERIIQFGGRISDKPGATIEAVSLNRFESGDLAEPVLHGTRRRPMSLVPGLPEAQRGEQVVRRAEWLLANYSPGRYNVVGNNCEHMANWCVTGWYAESHQVRVGFGVVALIGAAGLLYIAYRSRTSSVGKWLAAVGAVQVVGLAGGVVYNIHSRRFWRDIGNRWKAEEGDDFEGGTASTD